MKNRISKILGVVMAIAMLASIMVVGPAAASAAGNPAVINSWENLTLPTTDENTDVILLTQAEDGTIYAAVKHWFFPGVFNIAVTGGSLTATLDANSPATSATVNINATGAWTWDAGEDLGYGTYNIYVDETDVQLLGTLTVTPGLDTIALSGTITGSNLPDGTITSTTGTITFSGVEGTAPGSVVLAGLAFSGTATILGTPVADFTPINTLLNTNWETSPTYSMVKSSDGYAWEKTCISVSPDEITAIECSDNYNVDKTVYVAVDTDVTGPSDAIIYRCTNAAATTVHADEFGPIFAVAGGGTTYVAHIYSLDTYYDGNVVWLMAATDIDVFAIPDDRGLTTIWTDMQLSETLGGAFVDTVAGGGVEVFKAMFAPDYAQYGFIWALYLDNKNGAGTTATNGYGLISRKTGSTVWGNVITPEVISAGTSAAKSTCDLEFAADYNSMSNPNLYAALNFAGYHAEDDVYAIECSFYGAHGSITQFDVDGGTLATDRVDFCSLEVDGSVLIASALDYGFAPGTNTEVWYSLNDGVTWELAAKNPTGEMNKYTPLLISKYGTTDGLAFIGTGGEQSAISISADNGDTWNQIAYIDDTLKLATDIAFDPTSTAAALVTENYDGTPLSSLWKTADVTARYPQWQRTLCEGFSTTIGSFDLIEYSNDGTVAMLYDGVANRIYRSSNDLQTFANWKNTATWGFINDWVIYDSATVYAATSTGFWSTAVVGSDLTGVALYSVAIQTGFDPDNAAMSVIIAGDNDGNAYVSVDAGDNFVTGFNIDGSTDPVSVAFDSENVAYFATTDEVYSALVSDTGMLYNTIAGHTVYAALDWGLDDFGMPAITGDTLVDIAISSDDTIYVIDADGDMARYLLYDINHTEWDQARDSVDGTVDELWLTEGSYTAWTLDLDNLAVALLDDTLTPAVSGVNVSNIGPFSAVITWNNLTGATDYELDFYAYNEATGLYELVTGYTGVVSASVGATTSVMVPLMDSTEYKVYVRANNEGATTDYIADEVELSRWGTDSFMTLYYMETPKPTNPAQGTDGTTLNPTFGWSSVPNAVSYTFQLSLTPDFTSIIENVSVATTGHTYAGDALTYNTAYYWRVQAVGPDNTVSKWSTYTENYFSVTLEEFLAGMDIGSVMGFFRNGDLVFYWTSGAVSSFNTILDPDNYQSDLTVTETQTTTNVTTTQTNPTYTIPVPEFTVTVPAPQTTVTTITNVVEIPDKATPAYIWAIVAIGALLTIAVIVLIIRTRRVV